MSISANYPQPVQVNGYSCKNCTDVDNAKKHIDPAHPKSGPYGIDAATDPSRSTSELAKVQARPEPVKASAAAGTGLLADVSA